MMFSVGYFVVLPGLQANETPREIEDSSRLAKIRPHEKSRLMYW